MEVCGPPAPGPRRARLLGSAVVAALTLAVFWPVAGHQFLDWDDGTYVFANERVRAGLTAAGLRWALSTFHGANWHPLTWVSHMLDVQLFGLDPGAHHLSSLALHVAASVALLLVLDRIAGRLWPSALVSLLFAVHPLHVESVARVSARKDVLAALFWTLAIAAHAHYARRPGPRRYALVVAALALGLMAKPMVVTLPLVLLLLDWWPLGRWAAPGARWRLLQEKLPLLALSAAASAATWVAQAGHGQAAVSLTVLPLSLRAANAAVSCAAYLADLFLPLGLAFFYPYPIDGLPVARVAAAATLLAGLTLLALRQRRRQPFLLLGWAWFLVTLTPVIGVVQVGMQARADRYTYLPFVGLFVALAWGAAAALRRAPRARGPLIGGVLAAVALLAATTRREVGHFRDMETLARRAIAVTERNWVAEVDLAAALTRSGRKAEGLVHYRVATSYVPARAERHFQAAEERAAAGDERGAEREYAAAAELFPPFVRASFNLGMIEARRGDTDAAARDLRSAIAFQPDLLEAHFARGVLIAQRGEWEEAAAHFAEILAHAPDYPGARYNLDVVLEALGYSPERVGEFLRRHADPGAEDARWVAP